ncbi:hypothetical protein M0M42_14520 [Pseudomonas knackmussii]|uniref:Uncharacterized protein n=1 Tax=Pseudomonas knackmussii TaxID=65741 RepID=A0ABY4KL93_9PSED|nr:hypothetical protein [Pseudomonas knackmussii]UPQ81617.1 hypothetical protein M0M42_14520 [Pseudomonas knackmussii]
MFHIVLRYRYWAFYIIVIAIALKYCSAMTDSYLLKRFPAGLADGGIILSERPFFGYCGVAIVELDDNTLMGIIKNGVIFLNERRQASHGDKHSLTFSEWSETPPPHNWTSEGTDSWLSCDGSSYDKIKSEFPQITKLIMTSGSFYTSNDHNRLVLFPALKIAILTNF